jgi:fucose 4-O-acetylase-like acetyltransferase
MSDNKRIAYISNAQAIACLLVVFGHSYPLNVPIPVALDSLRAFIYSFHMELFVLVSGFLVVKAASIKKYGSLGFIKRRAYKLLIPYVVISLIGLIPKFFLTSYVNDSVQLNPMFFVRSFLVPRENIWGHFWFIPMIFAFALLSILIMKVMERSKSGFLLLLIGTFAITFIPTITGWFSLNDIKDYLFYYVLGMFLAQSQPIEIKALSSKWVWVFFPAAVGLFILDTELPNYFTHIIGKAVIASLMIFFVLWLFNKVHIEQSSFFSTVSRNVFTIFILSWPSQAVVDVLANHILKLNFYIVMPLMFLAGLFIPLLIIKVVRIIESKTPIKFLSPIIGGSNK